MHHGPKNAQKLCLQTKSILGPFFGSKIDPFWGFLSILFFSECFFFLFKMGSLQHFFFLNSVSS